MKNLFRFPALGLLTILIATACDQITTSSNGTPLRGNITISGAFALYPLMIRWAEEFQHLNPNVHFDISSVGAGKGMDEVLAGKVDIGMISRTVTTDEESQGAYPLPVAKDAVFALVNTKNPVVNDLLTRGSIQDKLAKIFITGQITTWGDVIGDPAITDEIHIYTRSDICGAAVTWSLFLGGTQQDLLGEGKFGDPGMVQALQKDPLGIGYNNLIYAYGLGDVALQGTVILPIDLNENGHADPEEILDTRQKATAAIASGLYPTPPARLLYLVTNDKPYGAVQSFLEWILSDGQAFVDPLGYVQLPTEQLNASLEEIR
jgi:phosphate transport system substrate-binding protein